MYESNEMSIELTHTSTHLYRNRGSNILQSHFVQLLEQKIVLKLIDADCLIVSILEHRLHILSDNHSTGSSDSHSAKHAGVVLRTNWWKARLVLFVISPRISHFLLREFFLFDIGKESVMLNVIDNSAWILMDDVGKKTIFWRSTSNLHIWIKFRRCKLIEFCQIMTQIMSLNLGLVDHSHRCRLLRYLSFIDTFFHGSLRNESIDIDRFCLSKTVYTEQRLSIMRWIPASVENDNAISSDHVGSKRSGTRRYEHQSEHSLIEKTSRNSIWITKVIRAFGKLLSYRALKFSGLLKCVCTESRFPV
ncbi:hypothetical protein GCK72_001238 [Caenorhabditis remanei]|uniref:Uncharacterized protein n=1 Tax=Caenorhabditis remanei TaxID=31234 RepID=A0A6A5HQB3_CAERE|nr:hypothetical protein GCK72_001238 [Caenorhabditis remanei]KAF1769421.1 hypothetical protein GCK72_001238 [Caenorhabditis remanei]